MRLPTLVLLTVSTIACSSIPLERVRSSDFGWLAGTWTGTGPGGMAVEQVWSVPSDGAMRGIHTGTVDGQTAVSGALQLVFGTNGVVLLGAIEGAEKRRFGLVEFQRGRAKFRARSPEYPAEFEFVRSGSELTMTVRGDSGLGAIRETTSHMQLRN